MHMSCVHVHFFPYLKFLLMITIPGEITPSYMLHTRAFGTYLLGGLFTLQKRL
jgi:hypothetical protein